MEKEKNMNGNPANFRDSLIIVIFLVVASLAYFVFAERPTVAQEQHQHDDMTQPHGSMPDLDQMIANLPEDYDGLVQQGNMYMDSRVYGMAIEAYSRALAIDSGNVNVIVDLGASMHAMGDIPGALNMFKKAVKKEPDHAVAHFNLGIAYLGLDSSKQAAKSWRRYLELEPNSPLKDTVQNFIRMLEREGA